MNVPAARQQRLAIVGATGMVGGYAFRYALDNPDVGRVTAISRRKLGISHPKLDEVVHRDFADCSPLAEALSRLDAAIFCLGTYTGSVSDAELRKITVDYRIEFARVLHGSSPEAAFSFLSGNGAETGPSRMPFARYKGEGRECTTRGRLPQRLHILTRVYLPRGAAQGTELQLPAAARNLARVSRALPQPGAMVDVVVQETGKRASVVLENRNIRAMAERRLS
jgi:hypothetical protein